MKKFFLAALCIASLLVMPGCSAVGLNGLSTLTGIHSIDENGGILEHESGVRVIVPKGALSDLQEVSIEAVASEFSSPPEGAQFTGDLYQIDLGQETFEKPIEIALPYDVSVLPEDRSEGEFYAAYFHDGEWRRAYGEVDTEKNIVRVESYHASIWTVLLDLLTESQVESSIRAYRCIQSILDPVDVPDDLDEADALVEKRLMEWNLALAEAEFELEELDEAAFGELTGEISGELVLEITHVLIEKWGGEAAVLTIGGTPVAVWGGLVHPSLQLLKVNYHSGSVISAMMKFEHAHQNLMAARAYQHMLKYNTVISLPDEYIKGLLGICAYEEGAGGAIDAGEEPEEEEADEEAVGEEGGAGEGDEEEGSLQPRPVGTYAVLDVYATYTDAKSGKVDEVKATRRYDVIEVNENLVTFRISEDVPEGSFVWSEDQTEAVFDIVEKMKVEEDSGSDQIYADWQAQLVEETDDRLIYEITRDYGTVEWRGTCTGRTERDRFSGIHLANRWECLFHSPNDGEQIGTMTYEMTLQEFHVP